MRQPMFKCDVCNKKLQTPSGLIAHKKMHKLARSKPRPSSNLTKLVGKPVLGKPKRSVQHLPHITDLRKIEYECPVCYSKYSTHFSTSRHIQKMHRDKAAASTLKPIRVETCLKCNTSVLNQDHHLCTNWSTEMMEVMAEGCIFMGCRKVFQSVETFDAHVSGMHSDSVQTLLFPTIHEFTQWKENMEFQTEVKYLILGSCNNRQTYHCTHIPLTQKEGNMAQFCPSSIVVREYSKSIQVHFYGDHHGHSCDYKLPDRYKKYLMTEMLKLPIERSDEIEDLYPKFKSVIDIVITGAYNADTNTLRILYDKALEMAKILKVDPEPKAQTKNMTDEQITDTLENMNGKSQASDTKNVKKKTAKDKVVKEDKIVKEEKIVKEDKIVEEDEIAKINPVKETKPINASPKVCFNDSYKEFVSKTLNKDVDFNEKKVKEIKKDKVFENRNPSKTANKSVKVDKQGKIVKTISKIKKKVVKTKIGQFKPGLSPKRSQLNKSDFEESRSSVGSGRLSVGSGRLSVDINYEVIEQEDDCNILVLKI